MSEKFNGAVTAMGTSLIAKAIANNTKMSFLKIVGSKSTYTDKQLPTLTDDVLSSASHDQEGHISNVTIADETTIKTELVLDGSSVEADYQLNTVLILATVDGTDHLFGVLKANQPQYMNAYDGISSTNLEINCSFKVANTDAVSIAVDTRGTLTVDDYNRLHAYTDSQVASASGVANKRMDSAVAAEAKDRATAVTSESTARSSAVAAEAMARSNAVSGEASARAAADTKLQNSASTAASDIAVLRTSAASYTDNKVASAATVASNATSTAVSVEATDRTKAVAAESSSRSNAVVAEAKTRSDADVKLQNSATANSSAAAKAQAAIDGLEVGARNYLINSDKPLVAEANTNTNNLRVISKSLDANQDYVFTSNIEVTEGTTDAIAVAIYDSSITNKQALVTVPIIDSKIVAKLNSGASGSVLLAYTGRAGRANDIGITFSNYSLVKGTATVDVGPAPEDKANDVGVVHNTGDEKIDGVKNFETAPTVNSKSLVTEDYIKIGGRNYILNSNSNSGMAVSSNAGAVITKEIDPDDGAAVIHVTIPDTVTGKASGFYFYLKAPKAPVIGETWSYGVTVKGSGTITEFGSAQAHTGFETFVLDSNYVRQTWTGVITEKSTGFVVYAGAGAEYWVKYPKAEKGLPSDWSPAPEDVQAELDDKFPNYFSIPSGDDLDDYKTPGFYRTWTDHIAKTVLHAPLPNAFSLEVGIHAGVYQIVTIYQTQTIKRFMRNGYSSTWGEWHRFLFEDNGVAVDSNQKVTGNKNFTGALLVSGQQVATQQWTQTRYDISDKRGTSLETPTDMLNSYEGQVVRTTRTPVDVGLSTTQNTNFGILTQEATFSANAGGIVLKFEYGPDGIARTYHCVSASATTWGKWYLDPIIEAPTVN